MLSMIQGGLTDVDIYAAVDSVKPVVTIVWRRIAQYKLMPLRGRATSGWHAS
ncbi:hypothetical protein [Cupriavidus basilensis]|uniref:hypothetical protein n=1 Tax=Cupriavidus basilensis TaxID=68895 RepID=UPI001F50EE22|nr:hypothetical protein [Cupriavidus basilensis]